MAGQSKSVPSSSNSLLNSLTALSEQERAALLQTLTDAEAEALLYDWDLWARPDQLTPAGDAWNIWLILAGRGWGKTRTGAEDVKTYGMTHPGVRIAIIAPTYADARDTCVEGDSGLLKILPPAVIKVWNRSLGELILTNGTRYKLFSADEPDRLRGPQHHRAWFDELAAWKYARDTFDMAMFGLRLGDHPQAVVTTTPKPIPLVKELLKRADVHVTRGSTFDNAANLAPAALATLRARYEGTRLGRQELDAEVLEDTPGALWTRELIEQTRVTKAPTLERIVVAVDPAATSDEESDETGIVVEGRGRDGHGYVLADVSMKGTPAQWGRAVVQAYLDWHADRIIGENNNGGEMVEHVVRTAAVEAGVEVAYRAVHASRGKLTRAEPISALYEQKRFHHVGAFPVLEDQQTTWTPGQKSPDHMDALVWGATDLFPNAATTRVAIAVARDEYMDPALREMALAAQGQFEGDEDDFEDADGEQLEDAHEEMPATEAAEAADVDPDIVAARRRLERLAQQQRANRREQRHERQAEHEAERAREQQRERDRANRQRMANVLQGIRRMSNDDYSGFGG